MSSPPEISEGEAYRPYVGADEDVPELTPVVFLLGTLQALVFGLADAYMALKIGQTVGASIPASVISMSILRGLLKRGSILENNLVQNMASVGESLACGAAFTIPALFLLQDYMIKKGEPVTYSLAPSSLYFIIAMGGLMGILFMIPMRRYLIVKEHGRLRYPEGTACAEVLRAGDEGGQAFWGVFRGFAVAGIFRILMNGVGLWKEEVRWAIKPLKTALSFDFLPSLLAVGYILGLETCAIMLAGAWLGWFVIVPLIGFMGEGMTVPVAPATMLIADMSWADLRENYLCYIGAGGVAFGGMVSLAKAFPTIVDSIRIAFRELRPQAGGPEVKKRTAQDIPFSMVLGGWILMFLLIGINRSVNITGFLGAFLAMFFAFFFVTVSSRIVGLVGTTSMPLSGMTIGALIITCGVVKFAGFSEGAGMAAALAVAAMVCIAISIGGDISQDLKIGFLVGATPKWVQVTQLLSVLTSAGLISWILTQLAPLVLKGAEHGGLEAPQSHIFFLITKGVISGTLPWLPVMVGVSIGACVEMMGIASLPFAVGLYLSFSLSSTLMFGALIHHFFQRTTPANLLKPLYDYGLLLCSGMVAGDALVGVAICGLATMDLDQRIPDHFKFLRENGEFAALLIFLLLCAFLWQQLKKRREILVLEAEARKAED